MRIGKWARLALFAAPLLAGCSNFWQAPGGGGGGGGGGTTLTGDDFFILNFSGTASQIAGYYIKAGVLTALSGSPYAVVGQATDMAIEPSGTFLYVGTTNGIYLYTINATTGALTQGSVVYDDAVSAALKVDSTGKWLLDASTLGELAAIPITGTGALDSTRKVYTQPLAATTVQKMAVSSNGVVAVALGSAGTQAFAFSSGNTSSSPLGTGSSAIKPTNSSGAALSVAFDPQNRLLYIGETDVYPSSTTSTGGLRIFTVGSGSLTELTTGSPVPSGGTGPHAILPKSTGDYVYVANWSGTSAGVIDGFQVATSGSTFTLTALSTTIASGVEPVGLSEEARGNFLLAVNSSGTPTLDCYVFDTTTAGKLDLALTGSTGTGPVAIASPLGQ